MSNNVAGILDTLLSKVESFASSKTVVGTPVNIEGVIIVPLVDVTVGLGAGGGSDDENSGGAGGGLGAKITPSAVLVINNNGVQLVNVKDQDSINKLIDMVPSVLSKFNFGKKDAEEELEIDDTIVE